ncbi:MAG: hypothetical protein LLF97_01020 [Planctomycetaceae bacterium]|nr:hypothetical protein [Planctomycetaceae bacterium]
MLHDRIQAMRRRVRDRGYKVFRNSPPPCIVEEGRRRGLSLMRRASLLTRRMCECEQPLIFPDERIVFTRTIGPIPPLFDPDEFDAFFPGRQPRDLMPINNLCADWELLLREGLTRRRETARRSLQDATGADRDFLEGAVETIDAVLALAERYAEQAEAMGKSDVAAVLRRVPAGPAETFWEALQSLRFCHAVVWLSGHFHVGLGRFDQYMTPYLEHDLATGRLSENEARQLLAEFFVSLNKDSDIYAGIQQGDNGQTVMLGGITPDGRCAIHRLTYWVLEISRDLALIDPKINLRIDSCTPRDLMILAAELTQKGLGFPQFSNDEQVIPGLVRHGYSLEDARDYTVAACWEFIIPGRGADVVNIGAVSFPAAVDTAIRTALASGGDMATIRQLVRRQIAEQVASQIEAVRPMVKLPAPYYSIFFRDALEKGQDISRWAKYDNLGIHGAASADAADALAAVDRLVFQDKTVSPRELLDALQSNFEQAEPLRQRLTEESPKVGNDDEAADRQLQFLFEAFADACETVSLPASCASGRKIVRPGTGSAMYYLWLAQGSPGPMREPLVGATANGRKAGDPFSANLAPSHLAAVAGPISVLKSFAKIDYSRIANGGPITIELCSCAFRTEEDTAKLADFVMLVTQFGCQQMQLNTLSLAMLKEAQQHPDRHRNLIVRVWGWSGYFCELAPEYQKHILSRHEYAGA